MKCHHSSLVHHRSSPTTGLVLPHLQEFQSSWCPNPTGSTAGNCSALLWSAMNLGVGGTATAGGQCPALWAPCCCWKWWQLLGWAASGSQTPHGRLQGRLHSAAFLRTPSTEAAGCLPLQQGWPGEPWGWQHRVSCGSQVTLRGWKPSRQPAGSRVRLAGGSGCCTYVYICLHHCPTEGSRNISLGTGPRAGERRTGSLKNKNTQS